MNNMASPPPPPPPPMNGNHLRINAHVSFIGIELLISNFIRQCNKLFCFCSGTPLSRFARSALCVAVYAVLFYGTIYYFELRVDFENMSITSKTGEFVIFLVNILSEAMT